MPNCFQLFKKGSTEASILQNVDAEIWTKVAKLPVDSKRWCAGWYDSIGLRLAMGCNFADIRSEYEERLVSPDFDDAEHGEWIKAQIDIVNWLEDHYTTSAWYERK